MKIKIIILAVALCACVSASAQKGEKRIGLSAGFSSELGIKYPQIGVSYAYNFTDRLGLMPSFDYYFYRFKETKFQMYDISVDARYSLFTGDKFDAYPILG
ncbi:MAG: porin family protein, partial [Tannerellaceae bacterium]|nr:porin family protein [Tannerellaceae bacterium]